MAFELIPVGLFGYLWGKGAIITRISKYRTQQPSSGGTTHCVLSTDTEKNWQLG